MRESTTALIERLSREAAAVKPLLSPLLRATALLVPLLGLMTATAILVGDTATVSAHFTNAVFVGAFLGSLLTGICAFIAAITLSVPGRSEAWIWLPLPPAAVWLTASTIQCFRHIEANGISDYSPFASADCFIFILMIGTPIAVAAHFILRRAASMALISVTALAGLGAASLAGALLSFFHPPGTNPIDLLTHLVAASALILLMITIGRSALKSP